MSGWRSHATGAIVPSPPIEERPPDWTEQHGWTIDIGRVEALARSTDGSAVFLLGAVENEADSPRSPTSSSASSRTPTPSDDGWRCSHPTTARLRFYDLAS